MGGEPPLPEDAAEGMLEDEAFLRVFHHALMEVGHPSHDALVMHHG